jgi:FkbM family methyltransferase
MEYQNQTELEHIGRTGARSVDEFIGARKIKRCRILSSYWVCTNFERDGISECLNNDGYWESWITLWMSANVRPGSVCIDAGATYGYYTFFLAQHGCKVYGIEANSDLIPLLEYSNYLNGSYDRVTIINRAVLDQSGQQVRLGYSDTIGGTSIHGGEQYGSVFVESMVLDELLQLEPKIDFIKLDISSSEERAWEGMQRIMQTNAHCVCIMEFAPDYYPGRGRNFFERIRSNYNVFYIDDNGGEVPISDFEFFATDKYNWRMLVIRNYSRGSEITDILSILQQLDQ